MLQKVYRGNSVLNRNFGLQTDVNCKKQLSRSWVASAGSLIQGEGSSHGSGHGKGPTTQHFPAAVAKNEDIQHEPLSTPPTQ